MEGGGSSSNGEMRIDNPMTAVNDDAAGDENSGAASPRSPRSPRSPGRVAKYRGDPLRRFQVKQYHLEKPAPREIELCVEEWQMVLVDSSRCVLQTIRLREIVCWSGTDERLNLLLGTFERISLKVRLDDSMSKDADKVYRPAKEVAKFLEERAAAARLEGEMNPTTSYILAQKDDSHAVTPHGLHTLRFDSTMDEISDAIGESHFPVEQTHLPDVPRDVQLYVGEMALVVKSGGEFVESHPYHRLLGWRAYQEGDEGRVTIRHLDDTPGRIDFIAEDAKTIRDMMLMHTRKLNIKALDVVGMNPDGNKRNYVNPESLPEGVKAQSPSWAVGWSAFFEVPKQ